MKLFKRDRQTGTSRMTTVALEQHLRVLAAEQCKILVPVIDRAHADAASGYLMPEWEGRVGEQSLRTLVLGSGAVVIYGGQGRFLAEELQRHYGDNRVKWHEPPYGGSGPSEFSVTPKR